MANIQFNCEVTEFDIIPGEDNSANCFSLNEKCLIINLMDDEDIYAQTEISKEDAIKLAKLILFVYGV
jgi:hypothetical protein